MGEGLWCPWCGSGCYRLSKEHEPHIFTCLLCGFEGPEATCIHSEEPPRALQEQAGLIGLARRESMR
jgi:hypothetical protein